MKEEIIKILMERRYTEKQAASPDFVNAYPKTHQRIMARYVDAVSSA